MKDPGVGDERTDVGVRCTSDESSVICRARRRAWGTCLMMECLYLVFLQRV
jgi:hypothetical protein